MELYDWVILSVSVCLFWTIWLALRWTAPEGYPPGPRAWPIIGHLPFFIKYGENLPTAIRELSKIHGPVIGLRVAWQNYIFINNYECAKEAFGTKSNIFAGRPNFLYVFRQLLSSEGKIRGPIFSSGEIWKKTRRFCKRSMREFGMGRQIIETKINEEMNFVCAKLKKHANERIIGEGINLDPILKMAACNMMSSLNFGHRFEYSDKSFRRMIYIVDSISAVSFVSPLNICPLLRFSPTSNWFWELMKKKYELEDFIEKQIQEHRNTFNANQPQDIVDLYLLKELEHDECDAIGNSDVKRAIIDLFMAGTDTTVTGISWFLLHMLHRPEVLKQCQKELDSVIGPDETLSMENWNQLPYLNAVIYETQRCTSLTSLGITRSPNETCTINGYVIPKESIVMPNVYAIHHEESIWENPEKFDPGRWLDEDGLFKLHEGFFLWGFAPRNCLGEKLAKSQLFLIIGTLLQRFQISSADAIIPPLEGRQGIVFTPPPFKVFINAR